MAATSAAKQKSDIFLDATGKSIIVFLDSEVPDVLHTIRILKESGATLCGNPLDAKFIISDLNSKSGRKYIHEWGKDGSKIVLEPRWVTKCIKARRLLQDEDNWGGCALSEINLKSDQAESASKAQEHSSQFSARPFSRSRTSQKPAGSPNSPLSSSSWSQSSRDLVATASSNAISRSGNSLECSTFPNGQQLLLPNSIPQTVPWHNPSQMSANSSLWHVPMANQMHLSGAQCLPFIPTFQGGTGPSIPMPGNGLPVTQASVYGNHLNPSTFLTALADVYRANAANNLYPALNLAVAAPQLMSFPHATPLPSTSSSDSKTPFLWNENPAVPSTVSAGDRSESARRQSSPSPSTIIPDVKVKRRATSSSRQDIISPAPVTKIFARSGSGLVFFVQIDINQRHSIVSKIKKYGGIITSAQQDADYSILSSRSKTFSALLKTAAASDALVIKPSYVTDCVDSGKLLDVSEYLLKIPGLLEQRGKDVTTGKTVKRQQETERQRVNLPERKPIKQMEKRAVRYSNPSRVPSVQRPPSPTPPPEHTREQYSDGKYLYSLAEREYIFRYVRYLFEKDHETSVSIIAQNLFEKMPHHSLKSWNTTINRGQIRDEIERLRKIAGVAHRKLAWQQETLQQQQVAYAATSNARDEIHADSDARRAGKRRKRNGEKLEWATPRERDLKVLTRFFVEGGAANVQNDSKTDRAKMWRRLDDQYACETADCWEEFYDANHDEVKQRCNE